MKMPSAVEAPIRELVQLFEGPLQTVAFPGLEDKALAQLAAGVDRGAEEVARLEAELAQAKLVLEEQRSALLAKSHRALSYAKVYAEDQPEISAQLDRIVLPKLASKPRAKAIAMDADVANTADAPPEQQKRPRGRPRSVPRVEAPVVEAEATAAE